MKVSDGFVQTLGEGDSEESSAGAKCRLASRFESPECCCFCLCLHAALDASSLVKPQGSKMLTAMKSSSCGVKDAAKGNGILLLLVTGPWAMWSLSYSLS